MRKLTIAIHEGSGVHMTMYTNITLWTKKKKKKRKRHHRTELQAALLLPEDLLTTGMHVSPTKSTIPKIGGSASECNKVPLFISAHELCDPQEGWIKLLGVPINDKGNATTWIQQLKNWDATIHLLKQTGNKFEGASRQFIRLAGCAVLTSRITYGSTCFNSTRAQLKQLTILHHKLLWIKPYRSSKTYPDWSLLYLHQGSSNRISNRIRQLHPLRQTAPMKTDCTHEDKLHPWSLIA